MELIKETNCNENDSFSAAALPLHQLFSANSPNVPQNLNELSKSLLTLINNASSSNAPHSVPPAHHQSTNSDLPKSSASTSNDESVDSQTCNGDGDGNTKRTRCRRRKPQKTIRMANDAPLAPLANGTCADSSSRSHKISEKSLEDTSQTHSMDLSNYSAGHQAFSNGKLTNSIFSGTTAKPMNGFATMNMTHYPDPLSSMPSASNHLKATFNTDDLVKKVEEIVKCNSNEAPPPPTNFAPIRNGDENKGFIEQLSNGDDKNGSISQPVSDDRASPERLNGNENGIDLMTSHETDAKTSKANMDEVPLMPTAEVKLPDISLPMANSTPKHNHVDEVENHLDKMFSHIENVAASTTTATATNGNSVAEDTTQNDSENQNSQTNNETNNDSELAAKSNDEQGTSSAAATATATASTSQSKPSRSRKRPAANGKKRGSSSARRPNKTNSKASSNGKNAAKNSNASKNNKNVKSNRSTEKVDSKKPKDELTAAEPVTKFRGPYIQIQPDGSENIVNAPLTEEIIEKQNRIRKTVIAGGSSARSKVSGLHVSTLSNKYDAVTTDASWMCVFCKLGPHKYGLGDLFGPFILSVDSKEFQESQFDPSEDVFRSHRTSADMVLVKGGMKVVPAKASTSSAATANNAGNVSSMVMSIFIFTTNFPFIFSFFSYPPPLPPNHVQSSCRKKRKLTEPSTSTQPPIFVPNIFHGMTKVSETAYEVWVHEDCVVWADGVYLVGARIVGLDAAVWSCSRHKCSICEQYGAVVTCLKRECKIEAHVPCAMRAQWSLNEATFQTHCKLHAITDSGSADTADDGSRHQTKEI